MNEVFGFLSASPIIIIALIMSVWVGCSLVTFERPSCYAPRNVWVRRVEHLFTVTVFILLFFAPCIPDPITEAVPFLSYLACAIFCLFAGIAGAIAAALVKWILCLEG